MIHKKIQEQQNSGLTFKGTKHSLDKDSQSLKADRPVLTCDCYIVLACQEIRKKFDVTENIKKIRVSFKWLLLFLFPNFYLYAYFNSFSSINNREKFLLIVV